MNKINWIHFTTRFLHLRETGLITTKSILNEIPINLRFFCISFREK